MHDLQTYTQEEELVDTPKRSLFTHYIEWGGKNLRPVIYTVKELANKKEFIVKHSITESQNKPLSDGNSGERGTIISENIPGGKFPQETC